MKCITLGFKKTTQTVQSVCDSFTAELEIVQKQQLAARDAAKLKADDLATKEAAARLEATNAQEEANSAQVAIGNIKTLFGKRGS